MGGLSGVTLYKLYPPAPSPEARPPSFWGSQPCVPAAWLAERLLLAGDIESNPAPKPTLKILDLWMSPERVVPLLIRWKRCLAGLSREIGLSDPSTATHRRGRSTTTGHPMFQEDTACTRLECCRHLHKLCLHNPCSQRWGPLPFLGKPAVPPCRLAGTAPHTSGGRRVVVCPFQSSSSLIQVLRV